MNKKVVIIGGGIAGLEAASGLNGLGYDVVIVEKGQTVGGNVIQWDRLFPLGEKAENVLRVIRAGAQNSAKILTEVWVKKCSKKNDKFELLLSDGTNLDSDAVLITTGFNTFKAKRKEEYGYGIYDNVITSVDLEKMLTQREVFKHDGSVPEKVAFIHCVGSRDDKVGNNYCSKVCCVTAVKQASEFKELYPNADVYCLYMDLRMFDRHFEELYKKAQADYGVQFIRGRLSEAAEDINGNIIIKAEDTLLGKPFKITVDMIVLMVGMEARRENDTIVEQLQLNEGLDRFYLPQDEYINANSTKNEGVFLAGCCTGPKTIPETIADARASVIKINSYLNK